jgi:hypothetical protein
MVNSVSKSKNDGEFTREVANPIVIVQLKMEEVCICLNVIGTWCIRKMITIEKEDLLYRAFKSQTMLAQNKQKINNKGQLPLYMGIV